MSENESKPLTACDGVGMASIVWMIAGTIILSGVTTCHKQDKNTLKAKAVELGAAQWIVDPKTGETIFTWKDEVKP